MNWIPCNQKEFVDDFVAQHIFAIHKKVLRSLVANEKKNECFFYPQRNASRIADLTEKMPLKV